MSFTVLHREKFQIIKTINMDQLVSCKLQNNLPPISVNLSKFVINHCRYQLFNQHLNKII